MGSRFGLPGGRGAGGRRIGVAIGADAITAIVGESQRVLRVPIVAGGNDTDAIGAAMSALAARLTDEHGDRLNGARVHVALLPPHCDARLVQLPPLRPREAAQVLRRDASRHFVGGAAARAVAVLPGKRALGPAGKARPVLAAAAPIGLLEAIAGMVRSAGWTIESIVPAQAAWIAGAEPVTSEKHGGRRHLIVAADTDAVHVVVLDGGVREMRRAPVAWPEEVVAAAGSGPGIALIHAEGAQRDRLSRALSDAGWTVSDRGVMGNAAESAAQFASEAEMELTAPSIALARQRRDRHMAVRAAAVAVLLLAGVAGLELWGVQRELASVRARRAAIRDDVAPLLAVRDSLAQLQAWSARVQRLDDESPRWSRALFDISMLLPEDAHIVMLEVSGDTMRAEVVGARAAQALQALRPATSLTNLRMDGVVERDLEEGTTSTERFRFTAQLAAPTEAPPAPATEGEAKSVARRSP